MEAQNEPAKEPRKSRHSERTKIEGATSEDVRRHAAPLLVDALRRMLARAERLGPFIVLQDAATHKFVQWCGSSEKRLRFEAPTIDLVAAPGADLALAAEQALDVLEFLCVTPQSGPPFTAGLVLSEEDTFEPRESSEPCG